MASAVFVNVASPQVALLSGVAVRALPTVVAAPAAAGSASATAAAIAGSPVRLE